MEFTNTHTCRDCGSTDIFVADSRKKKNGLIYRQKKCAHCGATMVTYEMERTDFQNLTATLESGVQMKHIELARRRINNLLVEMENEFKENKEVETNG